MTTAIFQHVNGPQRAYDLRQGDWATFDCDGTDCRAADHVAREHPLNEVECWQGAAIRWQEAIDAQPEWQPYRDALTRCLWRQMMAEETLEPAEYDPIGNGPIWRR